MDYNDKTSKFIGNTLQKYMEGFIILLKWINKQEIQRRE